MPGPAHTGQRGVLLSGAGAGPRSFSEFCSSLGLDSNLYPELSDSLLLMWSCSRFETWYHLSESMAGLNTQQACVPIKPICLSWVGDGGRETGKHQWPG